MRRTRGVAILDALIASIVLVFGAVTFYSFIPVTGRAEYLARQQTVSVQIGNRMIEQLLLLKPQDLNARSLISLNLIDANQTTSPYSITNLPMDDGWNYSPAKALPNGSGQMFVTDSTNGSKLVRIVLNWTSYGKAQSYTTGTVLGGYR